MDYPKKSEIVLQNSWDYLAKRAGEEDAFYLARLRRGLVTIAGHPAYKHSFQIALFVKPYPGSGPDDVKVSQLERIEDELREYLESENESILAVVCHARFLRELIFYTSDPETTLIRFDSIRKIVASHNMSACIQPSHDWHLYKEFVLKSEDN